MTETTNYNYVTRSETNSTQPIIERLRYRSSVSTVVQAVDEAASLIERQQKAIDLLLRAIKPFAETMSYFSEDGFDDDDIDKILLGSNIAPAHLRAARSAKEQAERVLKGEGK